MSRIVLISAVIFFNVCGHLFFKAGMNKIGAVPIGQLVTNLPRIITTPFVLLGIFSHVSSLTLYLVVLSRVDLSYVFPLIMGVGYTLIVLFSWQIFAEPFSSFKWLGIGLILMGVLLLGK